MHDDVAATVKALEQITVPQLKRRYAEVFGEPTRVKSQRASASSRSVPMRWARPRYSYSRNRTDDLGHS